MTTVKDDSGFLTAQQRADLGGVTTPFNAVVEYVDLPKPLLNASAKACVHGTNDLCVLVNPKGRYTFTYYGADVAPAVDGDAIGRAGNAAFRAGDWVGGAKDVLSRAAALHGQRTAVASNTGTVIVQQAGPTTVVDHPVPLWPFALGGLFLLVVFVLAYRADRRRQQRVQQVLEGAQAEVAALASANIAHDRWAGVEAETALPTYRIAPAGRPRAAEPSTVQRTPAPVVVKRTVHHYHNQDRGSSDLVTGMLLQSSIDQARVAAAEAAVPHRRDPDPAPSYTPSSSSADSYGGGGSYSGGSDWGGGGGGSFDSGGGGGGGGDF